MWIVVISSFSTDSFSSAGTSRVIIPVLKFVFPFLSPAQLEIGHIVCRKAGHVLEYFILGVLAWRALSNGQRSGARAALLAAALVLAVALSDEFHQFLVPSRASSLIDVGYDFIGGVAALLLISRLQHETRNLHSHSVL